MGGRSGGDKKSGRRHPGTQVKCGADTFRSISAVHEFCFSPSRAGDVYHFASTGRFPFPIIQQLLFFVVVYYLSFYSSQKDHQSNLIISHKPHGRTDMTKTRLDTQNAKRRLRHNRANNPYSITHRPERPTEKIRH